MFLKNTLVSMATLTMLYAGFAFVTLRGDWPPRAADTVAKYDWAGD